MERCALYATNNQESEPRGIKKSPFSLCDCLCSGNLPLERADSARFKLWCKLSGGLHHAEVSNCAGCILGDAERCRRCRPASQGAAASGASSGWQVAGRQGSDWQISTSSARRDQGLTVCVLDARKIERSGYASHYHTYAPLRRGISFDWNRHVEEARRDVANVRLFTRNGIDWSGRFPLIVQAVGALKARSCLIDGKAIAFEDGGLASFDLIRHQRANESIFLYAFDLIELNGDDLRRDPLEVRKATLASIVAKASPGIRFNEHIEGDGPTVFAHACKLGLEGIVSKREDSAYRSGRSPDWLKMKNPAAPAVKREEEEDWGK